MSSRILFICTHNSVRSQMAEGLINHLFTNIQAFSAGVEKTQVHPLAIKVMEEINIDISHHKSKTIDKFIKVQFDFVVSVCESANKSCPLFPGSKMAIHTSFEDPTKITGSFNKQLKAFRKTRNEIQEWLEIIFKKITNH